MRPLFKTSLASRFLLVFALTVVVPVSLVGIVTAKVHEALLLRDAARRALQNLEQMAYSIDEEAKRVSLLAAALALDEEFLGYCTAYARAAEPAAQYGWSRRMEQHLDGFFKYSNKIGAVLVFFRDKPAYVYRNSAFLFEAPLPKGAWYERALKEKGRTAILPDLSSHGVGSSSRPVLSVAVCPGASIQAQGLDVLVLSFRVNYLEQLLSGEALRATEEVFLADSAGGILLHGPEGLGSSFGAGAADLEEAVRGLGESATAAPSSSVHGRNGKRFLVSAVPLPFCSWILVSSIETDRITGPFRLTLLAARWSTMLFLVLFAVFAVLFFYEIVRPVHQVIATMRKVEQGDYEVSVTEGIGGGMTELDELARAFNSMVAEVHRLTREREEKERERSRLEMEALRLKINPHFLTNTLSSIRLMAAISGAENIKEMTGALMKVLNDCFRDEGGFCPLSRELDTLASYILIMKYRYGDSFEVIYEVPPELRQLAVPRMILQPIAENSILHGLAGLEHGGEIRVRACEQEGSLLLQVADNGKGMSRQTMEDALREPPGEHSGLTRVGLHSVHSRIRLTYGEPYGVHLESTEGGGTTVTMLLPAVRWREPGDA